MPKFAMEIYHTKKCKKSIMFDGFMYRKVLVNVKGNISYRCSNEDSCNAYIITDADGAVVKSWNTHNQRCIEREVKTSKEPRFKNYKLPKYAQDLQATTKSIIWYGQRLMEIETTTDNQDILYDGFLYQKVQVSPKGITAYRCSSGDICHACIVLDADGINVIELETTHQTLCYEGKAKGQSKQHARELNVSNDTSPSETFPDFLKTTPSIVLHRESAMKITHVETKWGKKSIMYKDFMYWKKHASDNGDITYVCSSIGYSCNAYIVLDAESRNAVRMKITHNPKCYEQKRASIKERRPSKDAQANATNKATAAASKAPASVTLAATPVSTPSVVSRQHDHEGNRISMATETCYPAMAVPQVVIETKVEVSSTSYEEPEELELNPADGISQEIGDLDEVKEQQKQIQRANKQKELMLVKTVSKSQDLGDLDEFREQQIQIQRANKQMELILAKTVSKRHDKTEEEAQKLCQMQKELLKLDNLRAADVAHIRDKIKKVGRLFLEALEHYNKTESNDAKLDLQQRCELKAQLTEQLNTVIHQHDVRKAGKLQEIMSELEIEYPSSDTVPLNFLPPQSSFVIHDVNTFHSHLTSPESSTSSYTSRLPTPPHPRRSTVEPAAFLPQPQISIKQECLAVDDCMDTVPPIHIKSENNLEENSDLDTFASASEKQRKKRACEPKKDNSIPKYKRYMTDPRNNLSVVLY